MPTYSIADLTLPSAVASFSKAARPPTFVLTIIFHPETDRIGEIAYFDKVAGKDCWVLGRCEPEFSRPNTSGSDRGLEDKYISRAALKLQIAKEGLVLDRAPDSSRCNVQGTDIGTEATVSKAQLKRGIPMQLGGRVVLLLREGSALEVGSGAAAGMGLVGSSAYMRDVRAQIALLAATDLDVLIQGETGTGKELVAAAMHEASRRSSGSLVAVNMAAIPEALAPAALFGSAKGAFTGAEKSMPGYFEQADGSTLFLDEIGDTSQEVQPLLLRALQQREIQSVGGAIKAVDIRVISATDASLNEDQCGFKAALRYRLAEGEIELDPLRSHPEDIGALLSEFVGQELISRGRERLLPSQLNTPANIATWSQLFYAFVCYHWPGNVRQLLNYARQVAVASEQSLVIPDTVQKALLVSEKVSQLPTEATYPPKSYSDNEFRASCERARYEVTRVAKELGLSRQAVYRRISEMSDLCLASEVPTEKIRAALLETGGDLALAAMQLKVSLVGLRERIRNSPQISTP